MSHKCISFFILVTTCWLVNTATSEASRFEFGGALKQELILTKTTDSDVVSVVKFAVQYVEEKTPWAVPKRLGGEAWQHPFVANLTKVNLIFSADDIMPVYFDDAVTDRNGQHYGITSMIVFGAIYRFQLLWKEKSLRYFHNFTVSVAPRNDRYIYSHTFVIASENATEIAKLNKESLRMNLKNPVFIHLPVNTVLQDSSYFDLDSFVQSDVDEFDYKHMTESGSQSEQSGCALDSNKCDKIYSDENLKYFKFKNRHFSVMSYNIWNMNPKSEENSSDQYVKRMKRLKKVIFDVDPDILGLQEVRFEEIQGGELGPSQIQTISDWFPAYQYVFQPGQMQPNSLYEGRTEEGVAILSKFPIVSHSHKFLFRNISNSADRHQRVLLHTELLIPLLGKVHILNTHLSLSHEAREESVVEIWQYVKQLQGPVIFMGDLNAEPQERAIQYLSGKDVLEAESPQWQDVWVEKHGQESEGFTYNPREELHKRIDYMYIKHSDTCCHIESCDLIDNGKRGLKAASDHLPLHAVFSFQVKK